MKKALITGITGQDGSYLAELLLSKGYAVYGLVRRAAVEDPSCRFSRINHIMDKITLIGGTIENYSSVFSVVEQVMPDECYHLAAQSFVAESFKDPFSIVSVNIAGTLNVLESIKTLVPECKLYFAASSEMFGEVLTMPQNEDTPFYPRSPYGISKVTGFDLVRNYRESYEIFGSSGILFNHESPRRGYEFVTRKITSTVAKIKKGEVNELRLGNLDARRDWGFAKEYVEAMWLMLQQDKPGDFVIATNETHTVKEFVSNAFGSVGLDWEKYVVVDSEFYRPADVHVLQGDYTKATQLLGWRPVIKFYDLVDMMVAADLQEIK